jgi:hypothetical protein
MKKLLIMTCALCVFTGAANAAANTGVNKVNEGVKGNIEKFQKPPVEGKAPDMEHVKKFKKSHDAAFEQKLGLTEVQKLKARELRKSGHEKIKPVMDDIRLKKQEAEMVRNSKLTVEAQEEKLTAIDKDLKVLEKQAQQIRKQNMKDFEAILTRSQKKTLKNMKKEGRKNFEKNRKEIILPPPCKKFEK